MSKGSLPPTPYPMHSARVERMGAEFLARLNAPPQGVPADPDSYRHHNIGRAYYHKLTHADRLGIGASERSARELADAYGVSRDYVHRLKRRYRDGELA